MPVTITIRDVPSETRDRLARQAAAAGQSMQQYVRARLIDLGHAEYVPGSGTRISPRRRLAGSRLADLPRHELRTASSIDQLLADERDR